MHLSSYIKFNISWYISDSKPTTAIEWICQQCLLPFSYASLLWIHSNPTSPVHHIMTSLLSCELYLLHFSAYKVEIPVY